MNNREAIVRIREVINFTESIDSCSDEDMQDVKALRMAIKALKESEWIPVSEPPKKEGMYLVTLKNEKVETCYYHISESGGVTGFANPFITAWKLLPEPHKADKGDTE